MTEVDGMPYGLTPWKLLKYECCCQASWLLIRRRFSHRKQPIENQNNYFCSGTLCSAPTPTPQRPDRPGCFLSDSRFSAAELVASAYKVMGLLPDTVSATGFLPGLSVLFHLPELLRAADVGRLASQPRLPGTASCPC